MKKILTAVDFSDLATQVIEQTARQAIAFGSEVHILYVEPPAPAFIGTEMSPPVTISTQGEEAERIQEELQSMAKYLKDKGIAVTYEYGHGSIVDTIVEKAAQVGADMIIMGAHSHGILYRAFIGSISTGVLKSSPCAVLVIREK